MKRGPDRDVRIFLWVVVFYVALLLFFVAAEAKASWNDPRLDAIASHFAGRPVHVECLTRLEANIDQVIMWGAAAYVEGYIDGRGYGLCERLRDMLDGDASRWSAYSLAWAVLALTHETGHLKGHRWSGSEAKTECWAVQHVQAFGRRMGIPALGLLQALVNDLHRSLSPEYRLSTCRIPVPTI